MIYVINVGYVRIFFIQTSNLIARFVLMAHLDRRTGELSYLTRLGSLRINRENQMAAHFM